MNTAQTTRRNMLAATAGTALAITALATTALATVGAQSFAAGGIAEIWAKAKAMVAHLDATAGSRSESAGDAEAEAAYARVFDMEEAVLVGPIRSRADAMAKLHAVGLSFVRGLRPDEEDVRGYEAAMAWLESN